MSIELTNLKVKQIQSVYVWISKQRQIRFLLGHTENINIILKFLLDWKIL